MSPPAADIRCPYGWSSWDQDKTQCTLPNNHPGHHLFDYSTTNPTPVLAAQVAELVKEVDSKIVQLIADHDAQRRSLQARNTELVEQRRAAVYLLTEIVNGKYGEVPVEVWKAVADYLRNKV